MKRIFFAVFFSCLIAAPVHALVPSDPYYNDLWYLPHTSADDAWDIETGSSGIVVAVLDAGVDLDHEDLVRNIWVNPGEIADNGLDDDGNGFVDDVHGWDFIDSDSSPVPGASAAALEEAISHGSVVAGIIGAVGDNSMGITGINWDVSIMSLRMLNDGGVGDSVTTGKAIDYAVANGADVINLSFSGDTMDTILRESIRNAYESGVVVVAAMGNENINTDSTPVYPACFGAYAVEDWVIGVASTGVSDEKSSFSNFGSACVDISAPGEGIIGLHYHDPLNGYDVKYAGDWAGTSMAAPVVSGAVALLLSKYPSLTPSDVRTVLKLSVDPVVLTSDLSGKMGAGRINIAKALEMATEFADSVSISSNIEYISGTSFSAVYALNDDSERFAFMDAVTYFTYEDSFSSIEDVSDIELSDYSLGGVVLPKAGVVLVKIQSDPRVYALDENTDDPFTPILREIVTEDVAISMYGTSWSDYVIDIPPTFFTKFVQGSRIDSPEVVDTSIMKTREELAVLAR